MDSVASTRCPSSNVGTQAQADPKCPRLIRRSDVECVFRGSENGNKNGKYNCGPDSTNDSPTHLTVNIPPSRHRDGVAGIGIARIGSACTVESGTSAGTSGARSRGSSLNSSTSQLYNAQAPIPKANVETKVKALSILVKPTHVPVPPSLRRPHTNPLNKVDLPILVSAPVITPGPRPWYDHNEFGAFVPCLVESDRDVAASASTSAPTSAVTCTFPSTATADIIHRDQIATTGGRVGNGNTGNRSDKVNRGKGSETGHSEAMHRRISSVSSMGMCARGVTPRNVHPSYFHGSLRRMAF